MLLVVSAMSPANVGADTPAGNTLPTCSVVAPPPAGESLADYTSGNFVDLNGARALWSNQLLVNNCTEEGWINVLPDGNGYTQGQYVPNVATFQSSVTSMDASTQTTADTTFSWNGHLEIPAAMYGSSLGLTKPWFVYPDLWTDRYDLYGLTSYRYRNPDGSWGPWERDHSPLKIEWLSNTACFQP